MDLKEKAVAAALRQDEILYSNTRNPKHAWHAWLMARVAKASYPDWLLRFVDRVAERGVTARTRRTDTVDRYEAALTQMDAAVARHRNRLVVRKAAKQFGVAIEVSRRDSPNLSAIAHDAAETHRVSVNRLLARYRSSR